MFFQRTNDDALGKFANGMRDAIEHIVDYEIEARREVGHIATEGLVGVDGNLQAVEVQSVVGSKELGDVRIFVTFDLPTGETVFSKAFEDFVAHGIHHVAAVLADHPSRLSVQFNILLFTIHVRVST